MAGCAVDMRGGMKAPEADQAASVPANGFHTFFVSGSQSPIRETKRLLQSLNTLHTNAFVDSLHSVLTFTYQLIIT